MIDLDIQQTWTQEDELYNEFGVLLCLGRINYRDWQIIVRRMGLDEYIYPSQRALVDVLLDHIYNRHRKTPAMLMWHALLMGHLESHYNETHQIKILHKLIKRRPDRMEKMPGNPRRL